MALSDLPVEGGSSARPYSPFERTSKKEKNRRRKAKRSALGTVDDNNAGADESKASSSSPKPTSSGPSDPSASAPIPSTVPQPRLKKRSASGSSLNEELRKKKKRERSGSKSIIGAGSSINGNDIPCIKPSNQIIPKAPEKVQAGERGKESTEQIRARLLPPPPPSSSSSVQVAAKMSQGKAQTVAQLSLDAAAVALRNEAKMQKLERKVRAAEDELGKKTEKWGKEKNSLEKKVADLERKLEDEHRSMVRQCEDRDRIIEKNGKTLDEMKEAVSCGICLDTLKDPHILSCGHTGCRDCLVKWFRSPVAFMHEPPQDPPGSGLIHPDRDLAYRTKVCHTCRAPITRRPARMYLIDAILTPLSINLHLPTASQEARESTDPWSRIFPTEKDRYRLYDDIDGIERCPECQCELGGDFCESCGIEFSEGSDMGDNGSWDGGIDALDALDELDGIPELEGEDDSISEEDRRPLGAARIRRARMVQDGNAWERATREDERLRSGMARGRDEMRRRDVEEVIGDDASDTIAARRAEVDADDNIEREERQLFMDLEAEESEDDGDDEQSEDEFGIRGTAQRVRNQDRYHATGRLPDGSRPGRRNRPARVDSEDEYDVDLRLNEEEAYEDSFIDDDEELEIETGTGDSMTGSGSGSGSEEDRVEDAAGCIGEAEEVFNVDEVRQRRMRRFGPPDASPPLVRAPASGRRRRAVVEDSD